MIITGTDPIYVTDRILEWFSMEPIEWKKEPAINRQPATKVQVYKDVLRHFPELTEGANMRNYDQYFDAALQKLYTQKYIDRDIEPFVNANSQLDSDIFYSPTIDGIVFSRKGGYQGEINRNDSENIRLYNVENRQMGYEKNMTVLTTVLALTSSIAALYYTAEMVKMTKHRPDLQSTVILGLFFAAIGGIITLSITTTIQQRK